MVTVGLLAIAWHQLYPSSLSYAWNGTSAPDAAAAATCQQLRGHLGSVITLPSDVSYTNLTQESWSRTAWKRPTCIALPATASDVQQVVSALVASNVPFAIRSGGHSPNPFDANIDTGVLIVTDRLSHVTYDAATGLASLGPGARWDAVYTALDLYNVTLVGGRVMDVGVGGLILGGGLSYLSDLYGSVCDSVVSFEVVLADGSVVEATAAEHPDLFWALKGGANNFGVVTAFKFTTYPIKNVWGGAQMFSLDQMPAVLEALNQYQTTPNKDPYANLIINLAPNLGVVLLTLVYLKPVERPAAYAPFYDLTPVSDQTRFMTLHELMAAFPPAGTARWTWYTNTFTPDSDLYAQLSDLLVSAPEIADIGALEAGSIVGAVQPISESLVRAGQASGGNALGLQPVNQTWFSLNLGWANVEDDAAANAAIESLHDKIDALASDAGAILEYDFMNDANAKQPVIASYGEDNVQRLRAIQQVYDPQHVFQRLVPGGQKIPV
ncbi:Uu.00g072990.m01.CDS01 [Anthostomella pinea]|uniref:Uu.00g072990.m01.CDS01 n=1 Tax=Anthostomella pinea TaxID=933095 RepID=A0AAI8YNS8_9PEZI|nr:Uu.00g072990.m01.CDS01 [Anthostomella pinea]